jgi:molybdenum cofactor cytidylyltransferase
MALRGARGRTARAAQKVRAPPARDSAARGFGTFYELSGYTMIVGVLLAAGSGSRFGSQKLLARANGSPIVVTAARNLGPLVDYLIAVVGSEADAVGKAMGSLPGAVVANFNWADGLSTSLRVGVIAAAPIADAVVIALGDQPGLDPEVVRAVIARWRESGGSKSIVATRYKGVQGHPVLLGRAVFDEVMSITGDIGATDLIKRDASRVAFVDVDADAPRDVDTPDDLAALDA